MNSTEPVRDRHRSRSRGRGAQPRARRGARRAERPERISRLCSYWLRHGLQDLRRQGVEVSRHGEVRIADLLGLPQFVKLSVTPRDLETLDRLQLRGELVRSKQGVSDALVDDGAYDELSIDDVPVLAFHVTRRNCREKILAGGVKPASELKNPGDRPHAYFYPSLDAAKSRVAEKRGRCVVLCVQLRAASQAGSTVLRTSRGLFARSRTRHRGALRE